MCDNLHLIESEINTVVIKIGEDTAANATPTENKLQTADELFADIKRLVGIFTTLEEFSVDQTCSPELQFATLSKKYTMVRELMEHISKISDQCHEDIKTMYESYKNTKNANNNRNGNEEED